MSDGIRKQRILDAIHHRCETRFPTQLIFSPTLLDRVAGHFGVPVAGEDNLMEFTDSHFVYAYPNDALGKLRRRVLTGEKIIFDDWGVGYDMGQEVIRLEDAPRFVPIIAQHPEKYLKVIVDLT